MKKSKYVVTGRYVKVSFTSIWEAMGYAVNMSQTNMDCGYKVEMRDERYKFGSKRWMKIAYFRNGEER